jgi:predicted nuclease with TOPRIM domain
MKVLEESHMALQASMVDARQRTASLEEERNCLLQQIDGHIKQLQVKQLEIVSLREQQSRPAIAEPFGVSGIPFPLYSSRRPSHDESDHCSLSMTSCASLREDADSPFRASLGGNGSGETSSTVNEHHITVIRELQERITQSNNMLTTAIKTYALQSDIAALLPVLKDANHFLEEAEKERKALIQKYNKCLLSLRRYKIRVAALTRENTAFRNSSLVVDAMAATPTGEPIDSILQIKCDHEQELFSLRATCEQLTTELQSKQNEITRLQVYLIQPDKHDICQQTDILEHQKTVTMENESSLIESISPSIEHRYQQTDNDIYEEQWKTHIGVLENRFEDANCLRMQAQHDFQLSQNAFEAKSRECEELLKNLEISTSEVKELNSRYKCLEEVHQTLMKQHSEDISTLDMSIKHLEEERLGHIQEIDKITSDYSNLTNQLKEKQDFEKVEQQKLAEQVEKITTLESSNANLLEQLTTNLHSFDILNQEKEDLLSRLSDLEIEFQETKDQSRALGEEVKRLNEDKKQLQLQMGDLNANYMETCSRMMELENNCNKWKDTLMLLLKRWIGFVN